MRRLALAAAILVIAGLVVPARAQRDRGLSLARAVAHEAGLDASADETAAIYAVIESRCGGSPRCQMRRFFGGRTSRRYLLDLDRRALRPRSWPAARFDREAWVRLLDVADRVVAGELVHRCEEPPQFWGMRHGVDADRARRLGFVEVSCSPEGTRNAFYVSPRRAREEG